MADLGHGVGHNAEPGSNEQECAATTARNARVGLIFFTIYLLIYAGYTGLTAFGRSVMAETPVPGLNVATLYGLGLIVLALVFAAAYGWICRAPSNSNDGTSRVGNASDSIPPESRSGRDV
jgi:uncharacterized membrane protein (DUF485 family)